MILGNFKMRCYIDKLFIHVDLSGHILKILPVDVSNICLNIRDMDRSWLAMLIMPKRNNIKTTEK